MSKCVEIYKGKLTNFSLYIFANRFYKAIELNLLFCYCYAHPEDKWNKNEWVTKSIVFLMVKSTRRAMPLFNEPYKYAELIIWVLIIFSKILNLVRLFYYSNRNINLK